MDVGSEMLIKLYKDLLKFIRSCVGRSVDCDNGGADFAEFFFEELATAV